MIIFIVIVQKVNENKPNEALTQAHYRYSLCADYLIYFHST